MKCPKCGAEVPEGMKFCGVCGTDVSRLKALAEAKSGDHVRHCVKCGRSIDWGANLCPYCGYDYRAPQNTAKSASVGGILAILASIISIFLLVYLYLSSHQYTNYYYYNPNYVNYDWMLYLFMAGMAVVGIVGGICALGKVYYSMAVVGGACSVIGPGFFFGIPALATIVSASKEFNHHSRDHAHHDDLEPKI